MTNPMDPEVPPPGAGVATVICGVPAAATSAAEMAAVSCVALRNVVVRAAPFQRTVELLTKPPPFTRRVSGPVPTVAPVGISPVSPGAGLVTVKACAAEVPPPGAGVTTVTCGVPAAATSAAAMVAVSWVALTKVVVRAAPFQRTPEALTKLLPFTVSVNAAPPTLALEGESDVSDGAGVVIVNAWAPDVPPSTPGIVTVTWALPAAAISEAGIAAVTWVGLTRVVVRAVPFQRTLAPMSYPVPVSVSVNPAPPVVALEGDSAVSVGPPALTGKVTAADVPPPGPGVVTVTFTMAVASRSVDGIAAVSWVALTNVVARAAPFHCTVLPLTKPVPVTVSVNAAPLTSALLGLRPVSVGAGLFTLNVCAAEVPPPGAGVRTVTLAVPAAAMSAAVIAAVSWMVLTKVVVRAAPFHCTVVEPFTNPVPLTVSVKAAPPTVALVGTSAVIVGMGLLTGNVSAAEAPPPGVGVNTVTCGVAAVAMSAAVIAAVSWVALTKVVVRVVPFQRTVEPLRKLAPFTVKVNASPPANALPGASPLSVGAGLLIENARATEVPPPGVEVTTVTEAVPVVAMSAAVIAAVSWMALTTVVVRAAPFHCTVLPLTKPLPLTVSVKAAPPAVALVGDTDVSVGAGLFSENACAAVVPPPGVGVTTVTLAVPAAAMSAAVIAAVSWMGLTKVVVRVAPFQRTVEPFTNPVPSTVSVKPAPPTVALSGVSPVIVGMGLLTGNVCAAEVPPPGVGVNTVTCGVPAVAMSAAVMAAVSWVALTKGVVRVLPFQRTVEPLRKLAPFTVRVNASPPANALPGDRLLRVGAGLLTGKVCAAEVPPPGAGVTTVTEAVPVAARSAAGIAAVSCVALTKVVVRAAPFHCTVAPFTKPLPVSVSVKPAPPTIALDGDSVVSVGAGLLIVKVCAAEVPPPGAGVTTVTEAVPVAAMSAAGIAAVSWVAFTKVVVRAAPFHCTPEPLMNPVPFTVRVKSAPPKSVLDGDSEEIVGTALLIANVCAAEVPPPGVEVTTVTEAVPVVAMSAAVIVAVSWMALTNVVVRAAPFHCTVLPLTKPLPLTVSVKAAPPAVALVGDTDVSVGAGLFSENACAAVVPPPGVGVTTVTLAVPAAAMSAAVIAAASWMGLTKVVVRVAPFQRTVEPFTNPVPSTVSVKAAPPTVALIGVSPVIVGMGLLTGNVCAAEVPPPGVGVNTVTCGVPAVAMSAAVMAAVSWVALTKVVVRVLPFQRTVEPLRKLAPFTVRVNASPPANALPGASPLSVGAGLLIENARATEVPPAGGGVTTVTGAVPAAAMSAAVIAAVSWVALTKVVVRAAPFHCTPEPLMNPVPFTVRVKSAPPKSVLDGDSEEIVGTALLIANVCAAEVPPPGVEVTTVTEAVPVV